MSLLTLFDESFSPRSLFAAGEQGAWYDPSDFSTLYQDSAGTTPVTALGQPVGLALDKRLGLGLGSELFSDPAVTFTGEASRVSTGVYRIYTSAGVLSSANVITGLTSGRTYLFEFTVDSITTLGGGVGIDANGATLAIFATTGRKTCRVVAPATGAFTVKRVSGTTDIQVSAVSIRELPGNHAYQTTSTARPTLQQDSNGMYYLSFDGTDDGMATPSINFTGTDKMTVWAGVRKNSDAAIGMIVELSASAGANNLVFYLAASASAGGNYQLLSKGTVLAAATPSGIAAPITNVLTGICDISGDLCRVRVNGAATSATTDQGTGNFGNYPLYIGRRGGTSLPFNGRIYGLIIRGAASSAGQIAAGEAWCNSKARAY